MSRAGDALREAPESECPHCGRVTKTTSDGICADCWGSKGGRPMGWRAQPPREDGVFDLWSLLDLFRPPW